MTPGRKIVMKVILFIITTLTYVFDDVFQWILSILTNIGLIKLEKILYVNILFFTSDCFHRIFIYILLNLNSILLMVHYSL